MSDTESLPRGLQARTVSDTNACSAATVPQASGPLVVPTYLQAAEAAKDEELFFGEAALLGHQRLDPGQDTSINLELYSLRLEKINQMKKHLREQRHRAEDRFESQYAKDLAPKLKDPEFVDLLRRRQTYLDLPLQAQLAPKQQPEQPNIVTENKHHTPPRDPESFDDQQPPPSFNQ